MAIYHSPTIADLDTKISGAKTQMKILFEGEELKKYQVSIARFHLR